MPLTMPVVWTPHHRSHLPLAEIWVGVRTAGTEVPERAEALRAALAAAGAPLVAATAHGDAPVLAVHTAELLGHLATAHEDWLRAGLAEHPGQDRVVPYVFPLPGLAGPGPVREPAAVAARAGRYCYDTMTLVGPGTYRAARAAVDAALTAADLVLAGAAAAYAICRPPGHHAARDSFGGSCYLNNAGVAVAYLLAGGCQRVAVVDLDAHHGNGTQWLFYSRPDVWYASVHVDPAAGWFPHFAGFAEETGTGAGAGANHNLPLAPGTGNAGWLAALARLREGVAAFGPDALVVSLGVDAAAGDPESPLLVTESGFASAGAMLAGLAPTVFVTEGGYVVERVGPLTVAVLTGFESASSSPA